MDEDILNCLNLNQTYFPRIDQDYGFNHRSSLLLHNKSSQKLMAQKHPSFFAQFLWVGNGQGLPGVVLLPFFPGVPYAAAVIWVLPGAGPAKLASLTCLVTLRGWLNLLPQVFHPGLHMMVEVFQEDKNRSCPTP